MLIIKRIWTICLSLNYVSLGVAFVRVIAGKYRGREIFAPKGRQTRPTLDRVREAVFSSVESSLSSFEGIRVLDLFSGSGAFCFESLSRGANFALAFDTSITSYKCIKKTSSSLGITKDSFACYKMNCFDNCAKEIISSFTKFDVIFLDPPYNMPFKEVKSLVSSLVESGVLSKNCLIYYESNYADVDCFENGRLLYEKKFSDTFSRIFSI